MKKIAWVSHQLGKSQRVLDALKASGFTGLIINIEEWDEKNKVYLPEYDTMTKANLKDFPDSILSLGTGGWRERQKAYPEIKKYYFDEALCQQFQGKSVWDAIEVDLQFNINGSRNYLCDEPSILKLAEYKNHKCQITYSSYRKYWIWLEWLSYKLGSKTGWRIPRYGNQIFAWQWLEENYGYKHYWTNHDKDMTVERESRFNYCWINLQLNKKHYPELIKWCKDHQKTIMLYVEWDVTEEQFLKDLTSFNTTFNTIYK
jgi:hypothetical protein